MKMRGIGQMSEENIGSNQYKNEANRADHDGDTAKKFESDLQATLDWLAEEAPSGETLSCPETDTVISHARGEPQPGVREHLRDCLRCRELASYVTQRDRVYQRQREYFRKQVSSEYNDGPYFAVREILRQTFQPFEFLTQRTALVSVGLLLAFVTIGVWQLPKFVAGSRAPFQVSMGTTNLKASRRAESDYGRIEQMSPLYPMDADKILGDLCEVTQKGGLVPPEKTDAVLSAVQTKKAEAPEKSADWERIESELKVYALVNRYGHLSAERRTGAPLWQDFIGGKDQGGNAVIFLNRDPSYDLVTYQLMEQSRLGTKGLRSVTFVTPANRVIPAAGRSDTDQPTLAEHPKSSIVTTADANFGKDNPAPTGDLGSNYIVSDSINHEAAKAASAEAGVTPVEILTKPRPEYTAEGRDSKTEGEVVLDVVFRANGVVQVNRVISGLGHGLDESAIRAVQNIKFKPAERNAQPVDFPARVRIEFRLGD
jgi:TonB family protein